MSWSSLFIIVLIFDINIIIIFFSLLTLTMKVALKMFLGITASCSNWVTDAQGNATECSLILDDIPFVDYVELPSSLSGLRYSNILCGVIRGALEQIGIRVDAKFVKDMVQGDEENEIRVVLTESVPDEYPFKDDE